MSEQAIAYRYEPGPPSGKVKLSPRLVTEDYLHTLERFQRFLPSPRPLQECWLWQGGRDRAGYGCFRFDSRGDRAHRASWSLYRACYIPPGYGVFHHCDIPACVNPLHLFIGISTDNHRDMVRKGRQAAPVRLGQRTHCSKGHALTPENLARPPSLGGVAICRACRSERRSRWFAAHPNYLRDYKQRRRVDAKEDQHG